MPALTTRTTAPPVFRITALILWKPNSSDGERLYSADRVNVSFTERCVYSNISPKHTMGKSSTPNMSVCALIVENALTV